MRQYVKISKETTYNTTPTVAGANGVDYIWVELAENDPNIDVQPVTYQINGARPSRGVVPISSGSSQYNVAGQFQTYLYHEQANFLKTAVLEPTVTSNVPNLPTYTIQRAYVDNNNNWKYDTFNGCKFTAASISGSNAGASAPIQLQLSVTGSKWTTGTSFTAPGCTDFPTNVYLWGDIDFSLAGTSLKSLMRSLSISIQHKTEPIFHANQFCDRINYYGWTPTVASTWDLESHTYTDKMRSILTSFASAQYATGLVSFTKSITQKVTFNLYNVLLQQLQTAKPPGGAFTQNASLIPYYDCTNLDMTCTVTNPA